MLQDSLFGVIHTFILPSLLTEGENPEFSIIARRMVHYFHNALVLNDSSDTEHLPSLSTMDEVGDFFCLFIIAIFLNGLDQRTYQVSTEIANFDEDTLLQCHKIYDLNAISVLERHQLCQIRGLAMDLIFWFSANYAIIDSDLDEVDAFQTIVIPFTVHIARQIIRYKKAAVTSGYKGFGTPENIQAQIESAIFHIPGMETAYNAERNDEYENGYHSDSSDSQSLASALYDLNFSLIDFVVNKREAPEEQRSHVEDFLEHGQNKADKRFFTGLSNHFDLEKAGNVVYLCQYI